MTRTISELENLC